MPAAMSSRSWVALLVFFIGLAATPARLTAAAAPDVRSLDGLAPDIVVAADGSGDFTSVQAAIDSIPRDNQQRVLIFLRNGTYREHVRLDRSFVTLRGEDRLKTRVVWEINDRRYDPAANADGRGIATFNLLNASDVVVDTLTIENPASRGGKPFAVFSSGTGTRVVIQNAEILGLGGDTLSLWTRGLYYHRNLHVTGTYHFVGPRGTCYLADSLLECLGPVSNALFNEGTVDERQKFVLQRCTLESKVPFGLGSNFRDAAWYFIECRFPPTLRADGNIFIAQSDVKNPQPVSKMFKWATDRVYFSGSRGPGYPWLRDNLEKSEAKHAGEVTAAWTFSGQWDPESAAPPRVIKVVQLDALITVTLAEPVTVKGRPVVVGAAGGQAAYQEGSGTASLVFKAAAASTVGVPRRLDLKGGAIVASQASVRPRLVPEGIALGR
jgi:pectinesterase